MDAHELLNVEFLSRAITFLIFLVLLAWLYVKGIQPALVAHQEQQQKAVEDAEARKRATAQAIVDAQAAIEQAKRDAERIVLQAQAQAQLVIAGERAAAEERAARALAFARGELERERHRARRELLVETVERAHAAARELAGNEIDDAAQTRLVETVIAALKGGAHA